MRQVIERFLSICVHKQNLIKDNVLGHIFLTILKQINLSYWYLIKRTIHYGTIPKNHVLLIVSVINPCTENPQINKQLLIMIIKKEKISIMYWELKLIFNLPFC